MPQEPSRSSASDEPPPPSVPGGLTPSNASKSELERVIAELQFRRLTVEATYIRS